MSQFSYSENEAKGIKLTAQRIVDQGSQELKRLEWRVIKSVVGLGEEEVSGLLGWCRSKHEYALDRRDGGTSHQVGLLLDFGPLEEGWRGRILFSKVACFL